MRAAKKRRRALLLFLIPVVLLTTGLGLPRINICPRCFSTDTAPIYYGIALSAEQRQAVAERKLVAGGCVIERDSPARHCFNCGSGFGAVLLNLLCLLLIPVAALSALTIVIVLLILKKRARRNLDV